HLLDGGNGARGECVRLEFNPIGRFRLDAIPQRFKVGTERDFLLEPIGLLVGILADMPLNLIGGEEVDNARLKVRVLRWQRELEVLLLRLERYPEVAIVLQHLLRDESLPDGLGRVLADWDLLAVHGPRDARESRDWHLAEGHAAIFLILRL